MGFTLANIGGRAALVSEGSWFDIARISGGALGPDPMSVVDQKDRLSEIGRAHV